MSKELTNLEKDLKLVDVVNNQIVVSSLQIAEKFEKEHRNVVRDIENIIVQMGMLKNEHTQEMFKETTYIHEQNKQIYKMYLMNRDGFSLLVMGFNGKNVLASISDILAAEISAAKFYHETTFKNRGKQYPMYLMDRDGFSLLVMGFSGKEALKWKLKYIEAFNSMEQRLKLIEQQELGRLMERIRSKEARKTLTDEIKETVPESPHKKFIYKHYTDLAYKVAFGMNAKQLREILGLSKTDNIRDHLSKDGLNKVIAIESVIRGYLKLGKDYDNIKNLTSNLLPQ